MSKMMRILKSDDLESQERQVERIKKEITQLSVELQVNLEALEKLRNNHNNEPPQTNEVTA
jgi:uncharacterized protein YwgA